jgi:MFS family permease
MHLSNQKFGMLFALSSLTGVLCGPFGILVSVVGRSRWVMVSGLLCMVAALFTVLGFVWESYAIMLIARFFFWASLYGMLLAQNMLVYAIFSTQGVALAMSMVIFAMRLGAVSAYFLSGPMRYSIGVEATLWVACCLVFLAFIGTLIFAFLFRGTSTARVVRPLHPSGRSISKSFHIELLRMVPRSCLMFTLAVMACYGSVFPFETVAVDMLVEDFGFRATEAGYLLSLVPAISLLGPAISPILGKDLAGLSRSAIAGLSMMAGGHVILSIQAFWCPYLAFFMIGMGYVSSVCALWGSLPALVQSTVEEENAKNVESLVLGLSYAALSIGQSVSNYLAGVLNDISSYRLVCIWFALLAGLGAVAVVMQQRWLVPVQPSASAAHGAAAESNERPAEGDGTVRVFAADSRLELSRSIEDDYLGPLGS